MKKVTQEHPIGQIGELIGMYRKLIAEVLNERGIYAIVFDEGPVSNPTTKEDYFEGYNLLKYDDGELLLAQLDYDPDCIIVLTKEEYENGELEEYAEDFENADWHKWDDVEESGAHSWACLFEYIRIAIDAIADED